MRVSNTDKCNWEWMKNGCLNKSTRRMHCQSFSERMLILINYEIHFHSHSKCIFHMLNKWTNGISSIKSISIRVERTKRKGLSQRICNCLTSNYTYILPLLSLWSTCAQSYFRGLQFTGKIQYSSVCCTSCRQAPRSLPLCHLQRFRILN